MPRAKRKPRQYYRRADIAKKDLSLDWLKGELNVRDVHRKTLALLAQHRLMNIEQLLYWHPDFGSQKRAKALMQRHLNEMAYYYLIDKKDHICHTFLDGTTKRTIFVSLGLLGTQAVGWTDYSKRIRYHADGSVSITPRYYHTSRVCDLSIITHQVLEEMDLELERWVVECGKSVVQHKNGLSPDAFVIMADRQTGKKYSLFVEFDTGSDDVNRTENFPSLTNKFNRYKEVMAWDQWYKTRASQESENKFPYLFFVTEEPKRFPKVPKLLEQRGIEATVCMIDQYADELKRFIERMRSNAQRMA